MLKIKIINLRLDIRETLHADKIKQDSSDKNHGWDIYQYGKKVRSLKWGEDIIIEYLGKWYSPAEYEKMMR